MTAKWQIGYNWGGMLLSQEFLVLFLGIIFIWLILGSFFLYRTIAHYQRLTGGVTKDNLGTVLEKILDKQEKEDKRIEDLVKTIERIEKDDQLHIQKVGLVRFNPFSETGGDQSFALAILDGHNTGMVISSLHSRDATRIYAKPIKQGKVEGYQFSKEEVEAISKACK